MASPTATTTTQSAPAAPAVDSRSGYKRPGHQVGPLAGRTAEPLPTNPTGGRLDVNPATGQAVGETLDVADASAKAGYFSKCTNCCSWGKAAKWAGVALFVSAVVVALVSTLVYTGVLSVALMNVGAMTTEAALYGMLTGIGVAGLLGIGATVFRFLQHKREAAKVNVATNEA